jgi:hypothetical protein
VRLEVGGTAESGTDYQSISRFLNLAPGQTTALIEVVPKAGAVIDGDGETVKLSIAADPAYKLSGEAAAYVMIVERDGTFAAWRARAFPGSAGALRAFANSDPGGLGISAIARYAFGLDPAKPDRGQLPKVAIRDGHMTTEFWRRKGATDIDYVVSVSSDLVKWDSSPASVQEMPSTSPGSDPNIVRYKATQAVEEQPKSFMNVRVILKP